MVLIDSPSAGSCLIPASLEPVQNSFLHREMGDSDGCRGNGDSAKPFPFSANEVGGHLQQRSSQSHSQAQRRGPLLWRNQSTRYFTQK